MPNTLLISNNTYFKNDLAEQITINAKDFKVFFEAEDNVLFDVIIVDDNETVLNKTIEQYPITPIIFISSNKDGSENINHFARPIILHDFLDCLKSAINKYENSSDGIITFANYELVSSHKEVIRNGKVIKLTEKEVLILKYLYKAKDRIVPKSELLTEVWGYNQEVSTHTIETHIYRLRQKIEDETPVIETTEGGYRLLV